MCPACRSTILPQMASPHTRSFEFAARMQPAERLHARRCVDHAFQEILSTFINRFALRLLQIVRGSKSKFLQPKVFDLRRRLATSRCSGS
jgi:hypothetical protein